MIFPDGPGVLNPQTLQNNPNEPAAVQYLPAASWPMHFSQDRQVRVLSYQVIVVADWRKSSTSHVLFLAPLRLCLLADYISTS